MNKSLVQKLTRELRHTESVADTWKAEAEKAKELANKYMWQVRHTCVRAEKAEAALALLQGKT